MSSLLGEIPKTLSIRCLRNLTALRAGKCSGLKSHCHWAGTAAGNFDDQLRRTFDGALLQIKVYAAFETMR
jgi:hypothetical protein